MNRRKKAKSISCGWLAKHASSICEYSWLGFRSLDYDPAESSKGTRARPHTWASSTPTLSAPVENQHPPAFTGDTTLSK